MKEVTKPYEMPGKIPSNFTKPCPNCNCGHEFVRIVDAAYGPSVQCEFCKMRGPSRATAELAMESWNELPRKEQNFDDNMPKACPFCGSTDVSLATAVCESPAHYVACNTCGTEGPVVEVDGSSSAETAMASVTAVLRWNDAPRKQQWTTKKPTKAGWYLARWAKGSELRDVYWNDLEDRLVYTTIGNSCYWAIEDVDDEVEWAGPILMPKEAEK